MSGMGILQSQEPPMFFDREQGASFGEVITRRGNRKILIFNHFHHFWHPFPLFSISQPPIKTFLFFCIFMSYLPFKTPLCLHLVRYEYLLFGTWVTLHQIFFPNFLKNFRNRKIINWRGKLNIPYKRGPISNDFCQIFFWTCVFLCL